MKKSVIPFIKEKSEIKPIIEGVVDFEPVAERGTKITENKYITPAFVDNIIINSGGTVEARDMHRNIQPTSIYAAFNNVMQLEEDYLRANGDSVNSAKLFSEMIQAKDDTDIKSTVAYRRYMLDRVFNNRIEFTMMNLIRDIYEQCSMAIYSGAEQYVINGFFSDTEALEFSKTIDDNTANALSQLLQSFRNNFNCIILDHKFNLVNIITGKFHREFIVDMVTSAITSIYNVWYRDFFIKTKLFDSIITDLDIVHIFVAGRDALYTLCDSLYNEALSVYYFAGYFDIFPVIRPKDIRDTTAFDPFYYTAKSIADGTNGDDDLYYEE